MQSSTLLFNEEGGSIRALQRLDIFSLSCIRGYMHPVIADGASGLSLMAWFNRCDGSNHLAAALENTLR